MAITSTIDTSGSSSGFLQINFAAGDGMISDFRFYCLFMLTVTAMMSAAIVSVIRRGKVKDGFFLLLVYPAIAITLYLLGYLLFHHLLGSIF